MKKHPNRGLTLMSPIHTIDFGGPIIKRLEYVPEGASLAPYTDSIPTKIKESFCNNYFESIANFGL